MNKTMTVKKLLFFKKKKRRRTCGSNPYKPLRNQSSYWIVTEKIGKQGEIYLFIYFYDPILAIARNSQRTVSKHILGSL